MLATQVGGGQPQEVDKLGDLAAPRRPVPVGNPRRPPFCPAGVSWEFLGASCRGPSIRIKRVCVK